ASSEDALARANAARAAVSMAREGSSAPPPDAPTGVPPPPAPGSMGGAAVSSMSVPPMTPARDVSQAVSHFPLERDPDSESAPELQGLGMPRVPGPPRLPQADARPRATTAL